MDRETPPIDPGLRVFVKNPRRELPENVYSIANLIAGRSSTQSDSLKSFYENSLHLIGITRPGTPVNESDIILSTSNVTPNVEDYFVLPFKPKEGRLTCRAAQDNVSYPLVVTSEKLKRKQSARQEPKSLPFQCNVPPLAPLTTDRVIKKLETPPVKVLTAQRKDIPNKVRIVQIKRNDLNNAQNIIKNSYQLRHPLAVNLLNKRITTPNMTQQVQLLPPQRQTPTINLIENIIENNKTVVKNTITPHDMPLLEDLQIVQRDNTSTELHTSRNLHTVVQNYNKGTVSATVLGTPTDTSKDLSTPVPNLNEGSKIPTILSRATDSPGIRLAPVPNFKDTIPSSEPAMILSTPKNSSRDLHTPVPILSDANQGVKISSILSTPRDSSRDLHTPVPNFGDTQQRDDIAPKDILSALDDILDEVKLVDSKVDKSKLPPVVYPTFEDTIENLYQEKEDQNAEPEKSPRKRQHSEGEDIVAEFTEITNMETSSKNSISSAAIAVLENNNKYATDRMFQLTGAQMAKIKETISKIDNLKQGQNIEPTFDENSNTKFIYRVVTPKELKIVGRNTIMISESSNDTSNSEGPPAKIAKKNIKKALKKNTDRVVIVKKTEKENTEKSAKQENNIDAVKEQKKEKEGVKSTKKDNVIITRSGREIKTPKQMQLAVNEKKKDSWSKTKENYLPCVTCPKEFRSLLSLQRHYELNPTHMPTNAHTNLFVCLRNIIEAATPDNKCFVFLHQLESFIKKLKYLLPCFLRKFEGGDDEHYCKINEDVASLLGVSAGDYKININGLNCAKLYDGDCVHTRKNTESKKDDTKRSVGESKKRKNSSRNDQSKSNTSVCPQKLQKTNTNKNHNCPELAQLQIDLDNLAKSESDVLPPAVGDADAKKIKKTNNLLLKQLHSKSGIIGYASSENQDTNNSNEERNELKFTTNVIDDSSNKAEIPQSKDETIIEKNVIDELLNSIETNNISNNGDSISIQSIIKQITLKNEESTIKEVDSKNIDKEKNSNNLHLTSRCQQPDSDHEEMIAEIIESSCKNEESFYKAENYNNLEENLVCETSSKNSDNSLITNIQENVTSMGQKAEKCERLNVKNTANENITGNSEKAEKILELNETNNELVTKISYENITDNGEIDKILDLNVKHTANDLPVVPGNERKPEKNEDMNAVSIANEHLVETVYEDITDNRGNREKSEVLNVKNITDTLPFESACENITSNKEITEKSETLDLVKTSNEHLTEIIFEHMTGIEEKSEDLNVANTDNEHLTEIVITSVTGNEEKSDDIYVVSTAKEDLAQIVHENVTGIRRKTEKNQDLNVVNKDNEHLTKIVFKSVTGNEEKSDDLNVVNTANEDLAELVYENVTDNRGKTERSEDLNVVNTDNENLTEIVFKGVTGNVEKSDDLDVAITANEDLAEIAYETVTGKTEKSEDLIVVNTVTEPLTEVIPKNVTDNEEKTNKNDDSNIVSTANEHLPEIIYENVTDNDGKTEKSKDLYVKKTANVVLDESVIGNEEKTDKSKVLNIINTPNILLAKNTYENVTNTGENLNQILDLNVNNTVDELRVKSIYKSGAINREKTEKNISLNIKNTSNEFWTKSSHENVTDNEEKGEKNQELHVNNTANDLLVKNVTSNGEKPENSEFLTDNTADEALVDVIYTNATRNGEKVDKNKDLNIHSTANLFLTESIHDNKEKLENKDLKLKHTANELTEIIYDNKDAANELLDELGFINNDELNHESDVKENNSPKNLETSPPKDENINVEKTNNEKLDLASNSSPKTMKNTLSKTINENNTHNEDDTKIDNDTTDNYKELLAEFGIIYNDEPNYESDSIGYSACKNIEPSVSKTEYVKTAGNEELISKNFVLGNYQNNIENKNLNNTRYEELLYFSGMADDSSPKNNDILASESSYVKAQNTPNEQIISDTIHNSSAEKTIPSFKNSSTGKEIIGLHGNVGNSLVDAGTFLSEHTYENAINAMDTGEEVLISDIMDSSILPSQSLVENIKSCKEDHMYLSSDVIGDSSLVNLQILHAENQDENMKQSVNENQISLSVAIVGDSSLENIEIPSNANIKSGNEDHAYYISADDIDGDCTIGNTEVFPLDSVNENTKKNSDKNHMFVSTSINGNSSLENIEILNENIIKFANEDHIYLSTKIVDDSYLKSIKILPLESINENIIKSSSEDHSYLCANTIGNPSLEKLEILPLEGLDGNIKETDNEDKICLTAGINGDSCLENVEILPSESVYKMLKNSGNEEIIYLSGILGNPFLENVEIVPFERTYDNAKDNEVISVIDDSSSKNKNLKGKNNKKYRSKKTNTCSDTIGESSTKNVEISQSKSVRNKRKKPKKESEMQLNPVTGVFESPQNFQTNSPNESAKVDDSDNTNQIPQSDFMTFNSPINFDTSTESEALFDFVRNLSPINVDTNCNVNNFKTTNLTSDSEDDTQDISVNKETRKEHGPKKLKRVELISECHSVVGKFSPDIIEIAPNKNNIDNCNIVEEIILSDSECDITENPLTKDVAITSQNNKNKVVKKSNHKEIIIIDITSDSPCENVASDVEQITNSNIAAPIDDLISATDIIAANNEIYNPENNEPNLDELAKFSDYMNQEKELLLDEN